MNFKIVLILFILYLLSSCQSQSLCNYNSDIFNYTDAFSVESVEHIEASLEKFIEKFEKFGEDNGYCIANKSSFQEVFDRYSANIRIVKENVTFHIFGHNGFILHFAQKEADINKQKEIKLFCDFISKEVDISKIIYYEKEGKGKLCGFD